MTWKPLGPTVGRPILDDQISSFEVTEIAQTFAQGLKIGGVPCRRYWLQNPDTIDFPASLRARYERPGRRAAEQRDE
ncbi:hypothetical protein XH99_02960 [Bradyrhizobium nanningense]|uniref:Uncharacterized protein n=1 Tax=Bradyrhizobium nanningense TaxID=1325118 RepID=A0A4Q0SHF5_9BRAD|nr:hypothetical protein XH84_01525 [Bradyrhizobium nanningense]RXH37125.1 hypothetical protein XH99_02960 [Bradyrhizobium nanningense]